MVITTLSNTMLLFVKFFTILCKFLYIFLFTAFHLYIHHQNNHFIILAIYQTLNRIKVFVIMTPERRNSCIQENLQSILFKQVKKMFNIIGGNPLGWYHNKMKTVIFTSHNHYYIFARLNHLYSIKHTSYGYASDIWSNQTFSSSYCG